MATDAPVAVSGSLADGFAPVRETFEQNFSEDASIKDVGASFCAYKDGECIVDIWGGSVDREGTADWRRDTLINVYSSTKALAALCVASLVDDGLINYSDLVTEYWPEFGQNGKDRTTIAHLMSHQSGNPGTREPTTMEDMLDWDLITDRIARQEPYWEPGTNTAYHPWTYGFLCGEIVRRVAGKTMGALLRDKFAEPLGAQAYIGLPAAKDCNVATLYGPGVPPPIPPGDVPDWVTNAMRNPILDPECHNQRAWRGAELPAFGGIASAHGLATIYAVLAQNGSHNGTRFLAPETIDQMTTVQSTRMDAMMGLAPQWSQGVVLNSMGIYGPNPNTFGHSGWGGSFVCADREAGVSLSYVCNQMSGDAAGDLRAVTLIQKFYECL